MAKGSKQEFQQAGGFSGGYSGNTGTQPYLREFGQGFNYLSGQLPKIGAAPQAQTFTPQTFTPFNTNTYFQPFSNKFDQITEYGLARGRQGILDSTNAANASLANRLNVAGTGDNSALVAGLQRQNQAKAAGAANALIPQALEQQRAQDIAGAGIRLQQQGQAIQQGLAGDQMRLAQQGLGLEATNSANQARLASYLGNFQGLNAGQNLLNSLLGAGQLAAGRVEGGITGGETAGMGKSKSSFK